MMVYFKPYADGRQNESRRRESVMLALRLVFVKYLAAHPIAPAMTVNPTLDAYIRTASTVTREQLRVLEPVWYSRIHTLERRLAEADDREAAADTVLALLREEGAVRDAAAAAPADLRYRSRTELVLLARAADQAGIRLPSGESPGQADSFAALVSRQAFLLLRAPAHATEDATDSAVQREAALPDIRHPARPGYDPQNVETLHRTVSTEQTAPAEPQEITVIRETEQHPTRETTHDTAQRSTAVETHTDTNTETRTEAERHDIRHETARKTQRETTALTQTEQITAHIESTLRETLRETQRAAEALHTTELRSAEHTLTEQRETVKPSTAAEETEAAAPAATAAHTPKPEEAEQTLRKAVVLPALPPMTMHSLSTPGFRYLTEAAHRTAHRRFAVDSLIQSGYSTFANRPMQAITSPLVRALDILRGHVETAEERRIFDTAVKTVFCRRSAITEAEPARMLSAMTPTERTETLLLTYRTLTAAQAARQGERPATAASAPASAAAPADVQQADSITHTETALLRALTRDVSLAELKRFVSSHTETENRLLSALTAFLLAPSPAQGDRSPHPAADAAVGLPVPLRIPAAAPVVQDIFPVIRTIRPISRFSVLASARTYGAMGGYPALRSADRFSVAGLPTAAEQTDLSPIIPGAPALRTTESPSVYAALPLLRYLTRSHADPSTAVSAAKDAPLTVTVLTGDRLQEITAERERIFLHQATDRILRESLHMLTQLGAALFAPLPAETDYPTISRPAVRRPAVRRPGDPGYADVPAAELPPTKLLLRRAAAAPTLTPTAAEQRGIRLLRQQSAAQFSAFAPLVLRAGATSAERLHTLTSAILHFSAIRTAAVPATPQPVGTVMPPRLADRRSAVERLLLTLIRPLSAHIPPQTPSPTAAEGESKVYGDIHYGDTVYRTAPPSIPDAVELYFTRMSRTAEAMLAIYPSRLITEYARIAVRSVEAAAPQQHRETERHFLRQALREARETQRSEIERVRETQRSKTARIRETQSGEIERIRETQRIETARIRETARTMLSRPVQALPATALRLRTVTADHTPEQLYDTARGLILNTRLTDRYFRTEHNRSETAETRAPRSAAPAASAEPVASDNAPMLHPTLTALRTDRLEAQSAAPTAPARERPQAAQPSAEAADALRAAHTAALPALYARESTLQYHREPEHAAEAAASAVSATQALTSTRDELVRRFGNLIDEPALGGLSGVSAGLPPLAQSAAPSDTLFSAEAVTDTRQILAQNSEQIALNRAHIEELEKKQALIENNLQKYGDTRQLCDEIMRRLKTQLRLEKSRYFG